MKFLIFLNLLQVTVPQYYPTNSNGQVDYKFLKFINDLYVNYTKLRNAYEAQQRQIDRLQTQMSNLNQDHLEEKVKNAQLRSYNKRESFKKQRQTMFERYKSKSAKFGIRPISEKIYSPKVISPKSTSTTTNILSNEPSGIRPGLKEDVSFRVW